MTASEGVIAGSVAVGFVIGVVTTILIVPGLAFAWAALAGICLYLDRTEPGYGRDPTDREHEG
jgi:hypothetical protein